MSHHSLLYPFMLFNTFIQSSHTHVLNDGYISFSTTSVLITTTLIYTIGAGITAAAGTRLALQLIS